MTLTDQISAIREQLQEAADSASQKIVAGKDNPAINRVGSKAFTMSMSSLGKELILSPFYHDWAAQYEFIGDLVSNGKFHDVRTIVETAKLKNSQENRVFAPEVIEHVKSIVGELDFTQAEEMAPSKPMRTPRFR